MGRDISPMMMYSFAYYNFRQILYTGLHWDLAAENKTLPP